MIKLSLKGNHSIYAHLPCKNFHQNLIKHVSQTIKTFLHLGGMISEILNIRQINTSKSIIA